MKLTHILTLAGIFVASATVAQTETDSAMIMDYDSIMMNEPPPVLDYYGGTITEEAVPAMSYNPFNKFKYNKKIKPEEKPDKKAVYSMGTSEMLREIANSLNVPYGYGDENTYVIIQFVVGRDSVLYNPEILFTREAQYSINATDVIEKLQYQFSPATKNGKPVDTIMIIPVHFTRRDQQSSYNQFRY